MQALIRNKRYCTWPVLVGIVKKNLLKKQQHKKTQQFFFYPSTLVVVFNWWVFRLDAVEH